MYKNEENGKVMGLHEDNIAVEGLGMDPDSANLGVMPPTSTPDAETLVDSAVVEGQADTLEAALKIVSEEVVKKYKVRDENKPKVEGLILSLLPEEKLRYRRLNRIHNRPLPSIMAILHNIVTRLDHTFGRLA
jgi:hypothetical protein